MVAMATVLPLLKEEETGEWSLLSRAYFDLRGIFLCPHCCDLA